MYILESPDVLGPGNEPLNPTVPGTAAQSQI